jgi:cyclohexanone monooxygenase
MAQRKAPDFDAVVVGAGFGGIRSLWEFQKLGLSVKCFEAGSDVGGAWYWNAYPGARTDSEAWVYNFNFSAEVQEKLAYSERYPSQATVQEYLSRIVG